MRPSHQAFFLLTLSLAAHAHAPACRGSRGYRGFQGPAGPSEIAAAVFTTAGNFTWTVPSGVTVITVQVWGPGGASLSVGPTTVDNGAVTGGGGGGGFAQASVNVIPGQTVHIHVGLGATESTVNPDLSSASDVSQTAFLVTSTGGENGLITTFVGGLALGGAGGTGDVAVTASVVSGTIVTTAGTSGGTSSLSNIIVPAVGQVALVAQAANGGASTSGGQGGQGVTLVTSSTGGNTNGEAAGVSGNAPGGGASGAISLGGLSIVTPGAPGTDGQVVIWY